MRITAYFKKKPGLVGTVVSGSLFVIFEIYTHYDRSSYILFLLSIVAGFVIGNLIKRLHKKYSGLTVGLFISLVYISIFLSFLNEELDWNLFLVLLTLPGLILIERLFPDTGLTLLIYIKLIIAGLMTLLILFSICAIMDVWIKRAKSRFFH